MKLFFVVVLSYMVSNPVYAEVSDRVVMSFGMGAGYPITVDAIAPYGEASYNLPGITVTDPSAQPPEEWRSGVHIGGSLGYLLDKKHKYTLSTSIDYTSYNLKVVLLDNWIRQDQSFEVVSLSTDLKVRLRSGEAIVIPYIKGGIGLFRTLRANRIRDLSDAQNEIGFGLDAGIDLALSERAGFFAEAQYQVGLTDNKKTHHIPFKVGVFLR